MPYGHNSFCIIVTIVLLVYLSFEDCRIQKIENWELIPSLSVGIIAILLKIISSEKLNGILNVIFYIVGIVLGLFLYLSGFFGGADLKVLLILLMVIEPTSRYGITSNLDGIQFFYYLLILILIFLLTRLTHNFCWLSKLGYWRFNSLRISDVLFLCISCRFQRIIHITCNDVIQLKLGGKEISFYNSNSLEMGVFCWSRNLTPVFPFITFSSILSIFI